MRTHTFGYYIIWVGMGITLLNMMVPTWPLWISFVGAGVSLLGVGLGYLEVYIRNRKK